ncbi:MAG: cell surface protein SprA, partial [Bacteroidaceae bacterium]|nr:cell surface protein SprA [Bacteroidaceae bacterium]
MPTTVLSPGTAQQDTIAKDTTTRRKPRYSVRRTGTSDTDDLRKKTADLRDPDNLKTEVTYDEKDNTYSVGTTLDEEAIGKKGARKNKGPQPGKQNTSSATGGSILPTNANGFNITTATGYLSAPLLMTLEEYQEWSIKESMKRYYKQKNAEAFEQEGKNKFDFTDMKFDLGPAEKIFGPGGVQIKTQGSAELKLGGNMKRVNNPALAANRRKTFGFDFDEKINLSLTGKVGDKINLNLNYNTESTFDYDAQNLKLKYDGKEDDIIKLIEAGNVSFPSNMSLVPGVSSLFGLRTDVQFGRLKMQTVVSQKKSASKSVSSKGGSQTNTFEFSATNY